MRKCLSKIRGAITITNVIGWGVVIAIAAIGILSTKIATSDSNIDKLEDKVAQNQADIAGIKAELKRLPVIDSKLDTLLMKQGIPLTEIKSL